jgi:hypothetical protein
MDEAALTNLASRKEVLQGNVEAACHSCADLIKPEVLLDLIQKNTPEANDIRLRRKSSLQSFTRRPTKQSLFRLFANLTRKVSHGFRRFLRA